MADFVLKRGASFALTCRNLNADGSPRDCHGVKIAAQLKDTRGALIANLEVGKIENDPAGFILSFPGSTNSWPIGLMQVDIKFTEADGLISYSETLRIACVERVTD